MPRKNLVQEGLQNFYWCLVPLLLVVKVEVENYSIGNLRDLEEIIDDNGSVLILS